MAEIWPIEHHMDENLSNLINKACSNKTEGVGIGKQCNYGCLQEFMRLTVDHVMLQLVEGYTL